MDSDQYELMLKEATQSGLYLHEGIERKKVDGVYGMYTNKAIKKGEVFVSYPKNKALIPNNKDYPSAMPAELRYAHAACKEIEKAERSGHRHLFSGLESSKTLKLSSSYYFDQAELDQIKNMSALLSRRVLDFNKSIRQSVDQLLAFDNELEESAAERVCINAQSRAWRDSGFLPVLDLFNHSDKRGQGRQANKKTYFIKAAVDYAPGDQVYSSYSKKDLYLHAINYNYFDPVGTHYIHFGYRFIQTASTGFEKQLANTLASRHPVKIEARGKNFLYRNMHPDAVVNEASPSEELIAYLMDNACNTPETLMKRRYSKDAFKQMYGQALDSLESVIKIDGIQPEALPESIQRFYFALLKEAQMIQQNKEWLASYS